MNINNAKTNQFQRRRNRLSKSIVGPLSGSYCIPEKTMTAVRKKAGASPHSGFHVTQVIKESLPTPRARYGNNVANFPGLGLLGEGKNGTVYLGYWGPSSAGNAMAIKIGDHESVNREAKILKEFKGVSPHIPALYLHRTAGECKAEIGRIPFLLQPVGSTLINQHSAARNGEPQSIMYSEYASGGNIESFFGKFGGLMTADDIKAMAFQVLWTLGAMQKKMPSFRHGDVIMPNIMVDVEHHDRGTMRYDGGFTVPNRGYRVMVGDFGLAQGDKDGMKGAPLAHLKESHGIGPNMMKGYDAHLFLTDFATFLRDHPKAGEFKEFVKKVIPAKYNHAADQKKFNSEHVVAGRLRHGLGSDIPSISQMLGTSYFAEYKKPKYVSKGEWPRPASIPITLGPRPAPPKKAPIPKVAAKAAPRLQRAQVVKMNNLIQAAKNMGLRGVTEENKALARAVNALIKNEGSKSPKLRPVARPRRSGAARSPVMRGGVNMSKMYNLFRAGSATGGSTINLTKPKKQTASRVAVLKRAINKERDAFSSKWSNITRPPLSAAKVRMFKAAGMTPPKPGKLYNAMEKASKNWKNANEGIEWRKNWLAKEKKKVMNSINNNVKVSKANLAEFVNLMAGKSNYLSAEQIARLPEPTMKNRKNESEKVEMFRGKVKGSRVNDILKRAGRSGSSLPVVPPGNSPATFFKKHLMNKTKSELAKYPANDLRMLAEITLKNAIPDGAVKDQVLNALNRARNNPNMLVNNNAPRRQSPRAARSAPAPRRSRSPPSMNNALYRLREAQELQKMLIPKASTITMEQVRKINKKLTNNEARRNAAAKVTKAKGKAVKVSKKNEAAAAKKAMKAAKK